MVKNTKQIKWLVSVADWRENKQQKQQISISKKL